MPNLLKERGTKSKNVVQKMLLIHLNNVTIGDLMSLNPIANLFFKPLPDHLVEGYKKSNNINIGVIKAGKGLDFHCNQIKFNTVEFDKLYSLKGFLRFKSPLPSVHVWLRPNFS